MKVHLLFADKDPARAGDLPAQADALVRDLGLDTLLDAMADGDDFLRTVAHRTLLSPLSDVDEIHHRQQVLTDCLGHPQVVRRVYDIAVEALESRHKGRGWILGDSPYSVLQRSIELLEPLLDPLRQLRQLRDQHVDDFESPGFRALFDTIGRELPDDYFAEIEDHLHRLRFANGVFMTAGLGATGAGTDYVLRKPASSTRGWRELLGLDELPWFREPSTYVYRLPSRDEAGARALSELKDRGLKLVADALAESTDHILAFFAMLSWELAYYLGCVHLQEELTGKGLSVCMPTVATTEPFQLDTHGLYDAALGLRLDQRVVGNDVSADGVSLVMITGANQGGKSTLLRALGIAQLMAGAGMFCAADAYRASISPAVFTHFKREEDAAMESGKLDEELARMSSIVDALHPHDLVLFNESFASTNEREGAQIARQIIDGLRESGVRIVFVTHMFELAQPLHTQAPNHALFLRPERLDSGQRTFRLVEGGPTQTSHGVDVFDRIFGTSQPAIGRSHAPG